MWQPLLPITLSELTYTLLSSSCLHTFLRMKIVTEGIRYVLNNFALHLALFCLDIKWQQRETTLILSIVVETLLKIKFAIIFIGRSYISKVVLNIERLQSTLLCLIYAVNCVYFVYTYLLTASGLLVQTTKTAVFSVARGGKVSA